VWGDGVFVSHVTSIRSVTRSSSPGGGFAEGLRKSAGERRAMRWRTVWRLTRLGRPPDI
jgi:hypothetical protein